MAAELILRVAFSNQQLDLMRKTKHREIEKSRKRKYIHQTDIQIKPNKNTSFQPLKKVIPHNL